ncbi:hypothetical protein [Arthrobacter sp. NA-172]|uniref:phage tail tube protein n=1 Tax=Arthrobacter sp. NA-172 TaxID=3367524 RepID=UPI003753F211
MGNNINNVVVGKPLVTGGVSVANIGATLPTDARTPLTTTGQYPYTACGYVADSGVVKSEKRNTGTINAWGGDTIAATRKGMDVTIKLELAEFLNAIVQGLIYGDANVTSQGPTAKVTPPVLSAGSSAATGGTLTAGSRVYQATYTNAFGESLGSNTVLIVSTGSVSVNSFTIGAAPSGATGTKIYVTLNGGTQQLLDTLGTTPTTYSDGGSKTPAAGTVPLVDSTAVGTRLKITATSSPTPKKVWVFDIFSDSAKVRVVVPNGRVMDVGDTTFKDDSLAAAVTTLQAFPDASGAFFYTYTDDGVTL